MELKRNLSAAHLSSASSCSDANKRRATPTPTEDSPLGQLFNDASIHALMREVNGLEPLTQDGKKFLISLQRIMDNFHEESANDIYNKARHLWEFERNLVASFRYAATKELRDKLVFYSDEKSPAERMDSMMKDPWLKYILGLENSDDCVRGFLSILIAYWNIKDLIIKYNLGKFGPEPPPRDVKIDRLRYVIDHIEDFTISLSHKLGTYRPPPTPYTPPKNLKRDKVIYVIEHVKYFRNLKEVVESKYGSDPDMAAKVFEKISKYQVEKMDLRNTWMSGKRARIDLVLHSEGSSTPAPCGVFIVRGLRE
ncbi:hypothetical protein CASFOL_039111 [Castilleja foliolosa]|uniref:Uncharacterized protein n=1 Tax=Castilleja foliolosa TaxID=1961234 RepID=A0ABD3BHH0_9LAMI